MSTGPQRAAVLALVACAGCASSAAREQYQPREQLIVLPAGEPNYVLFGDGEIAKCGPTEATWKVQSPGLPSAAGFDLGSGWAFVGYQDKLAVVALGTKRVEWKPSPMPGVYRSIGVHGETAALNAKDGDRVELVELTDGRNTDFEAGAWLAQFELDKVDYAFPTSPCSMLLIASRDVSTFTQGRVTAIRANGCEGEWKNDGHTDLPGLTWVHRCASDGTFLYVAGIHEETQLAALGRAPQLIQRVVILKLDPSRMSAEEFLFEERPTSGLRIQDLAVGSEALAVVLESGELSVYALAGSTRLYRKTVPGTESIAWIGPGQIAALTRDGVVPVSYAP